MKSFKLIVITVLILSWSALSETELFDHFSTTLGLGGVFPRANLEEYIDPAPSGGITFSTPYYRSIESSAFLQYSLLDATKKSSTPRKINTFVMGVNLVYKPGLYYLPFLGLGIANTLIQTTGGDPPQLLMDDMESEFGIIPMLFYRFRLNKKYGMEAGGEWHTIFSEPDQSHFLRLHLGIIRNWW